MRSAWWVTAMAEPRITPNSQTNTNANPAVLVRLRSRALPANRNATHVPRLMTRNHSGRRIARATVVTWFLNFWPHPARGQVRADWRNDETWKCAWRQIYPLKPLLSQTMGIGKLGGRCGFPRSAPRTRWFERSCIEPSRLLAWRR